MLSIKKLNLKVTELFIRGRKLNISFVFITQFYFAVPIDIRLNCMHYFIVKIPNKRELKQIAPQNSSDIDFLDFINFYKKTAKSYIYICILVIANALAPDNPSCLRKNLLEAI